MKYIIFILFPLFSIGQNLSVSDAIYFNGSAADKVYLNGEEVWASVVANPELYTTANAISIEDEADSATGYTVSAGTVSRPSGSANSGTYNARLSGVNANRFDITWTVPSTGNYTFSIAAKANVSFGFNAWTNVQTIGGGTADPQAGGSAENYSNASWAVYTWNLECTSTTGLVRVYLNATGILDIDSLSIKAYTP